MKELQLKELEKSLEQGLITQEEFEQKRKELEAQPTVQVEPKEEKQKTTLKSDYMLIILIAVVVLGMAALLGYIWFQQNERQLTIDELHILNLEGKLDVEIGFVYNKVYSFVKFEDDWYTQLISPTGKRQYNIQFRFSPRDVESISIQGTLDRDKFDNATDYFITFNPEGGNFSSVALAVGDFNEHMVKIFFKEPIAACDRNATACAGRPTVTCDSTDDIVVYVKEANETSIVFDDNCITISGSGFDLVKGINRVLYNFYRIME